MTTGYRNVGQLFGEEQFADISKTQEWAMERIEESRRELEELLEKVEPEIEAGMDELRNQYHWVSPVLRALGYCFSVAESTDTSEGEVRPDFTLFYLADDFRSAAAHRGEREFFATAIGVVRALAWDAPLDVESGASAESNPALEVDALIRLSGVNFGILTNGRVWRLFHRETSGLMTTFYEVDLYEALQGTNMDVYRYFWTVFSRVGVGGYDNIDPLVLRLLH